MITSLAYTRSTPLETISRDVYKKFKHSTKMISGIEAGDAGTYTRIFVTHAIKLGPFSFDLFLFCKDNISATDFARCTAILSVCLAKSMFNYFTTLYNFRGL
jgi:hypothetical protein